VVVLLEELQLNDEVCLKKVHPCGTAWWRVVRLGADIGLACTGCGRRILLPRAKLVERMRERRPGGTRNEEP
jgi:hypothetical protein